MKRLVKVSLVLTVMALLLSSCNCYKKMVKKAERMDTKVVPEMLSVRGTTVNADITVTFPPRYFNKEAILKITPVLVYEGGEIAGTPKYLQGDLVKDNYTVISWRRGGSYTQSLSFPYTPAANLATLELRVEAKCYDKCRKKYAELVPVTAIALTTGISAVQNDADLSDAVAYMADNYSKTVTTTQDADIMYLINSARVRGAQLTTDQVKMFEEFVKENTNKNRTTLGNVYSKGYASPDGPVAFNDRLSKERSETGKAAISQQLKGVNVRYDMAAYGEDWDGFKKLVEASDIKDKDLILQVLQMYSSPVQRDQEIKNMSSVFDVLAKEILPKLRRTQLVVNADMENLTDAELRTAIANGASDLDLEQLLYGATLTDDLRVKAQLYKRAADKYDDARAYNNLGATLIRMGDYAGAEKALEKAARLSSAPEINNNMAVVAMLQGDVAKARQYFAGANGQTKGLVALANGDYTTAIKTLDGYNLAVAEVANGNLANAKAAIANDNSAKAEYLKAVIASREGDTKAAVSYLKSSFAKDPSLKAKAQNDANFAKLFGTTEFLAL